MDKPAKCHFGRHDWEERENPETHERYEICSRCNAYRDHDRAVPGSGAAGAAGANAGGFGS